MIIPGIKSTLIKSETINEQCQHCKNYNALQIHVYQRYANIVGIPLFPTNKTGVSQCSFCKQVFSLKEMPQAIRLSYENIKTRTKTPLWLYSGGAVIAFLVLLTLLKEK